MLPSMSLISTLLAACFIFNLSEAIPWPIYALGSPSLHSIVSTTNTATLGARQPSTTPDANYDIRERAASDDDDQDHSAASKHSKPTKTAKKKEKPTVKPTKEHTKKHTKTPTNSASKREDKKSKTASTTTTSTFISTSPAFTYPPTIPSTTSTALPPPPNPHRINPGRIAAWVIIGFFALVSLALLIFFYSRRLRRARQLRTLHKQNRDLLAASDCGDSTKETATTPRQSESLRSVKDALISGRRASRFATTATQQPPPTIYIPLTEVETPRVEVSRVRSLSSASITAPSIRHTEILVPERRKTSPGLTPNSASRWPGTTTTIPNSATNLLGTPTATPGMAPPDYFGLSGPGSPEYPFSPYHVRSRSASPEIAHVEVAREVQIRRVRSSSLGG